jgi:ABC-type dipeptide/oligopeptide/nickel transport system permease component
MLRYALRRMLWIAPSVLGVSLLAFFVLSFLPRPPVSSIHGGQLEDVERRAHVGLPLFFNPVPQDLTIRLEAVLEALATAPADSDASADAGRELLRLGGAALPIVLPRLDSFAPELRRRITLRLAPLAQRMKLRPLANFHSPRLVVLSWQRFWQIHRIEFSRAQADRIVRRYARYGTDARADEARMLDTFLLPSVFKHVPTVGDRASVDQARRLIDLVADMTGINDRISRLATVFEAGSCVDRWKRWWMAYKSDYVRLSGSARAAAFVVETRYGKWALEAVSMQLGRDFRGRPILEQWRVRLPVTLSVSLLALMLAYLFGMLAGAIAAWRRGSAVDRGIEGVTLVLQWLTPVGLVAATLVVMPALRIEWLGATMLLALFLLAEPTRHTREALTAVLASDHIEAARARGAGPWRLIVVHGMRRAALPLMTRLSLELPMALTGCFVMEHAFGLPGLGELTVSAVQHGDLSWLMTMAIFGTLCAGLSLIVADGLQGILDPRVARLLMQPRRRGI